MLAALGQQTLADLRAFMLTPPIVPWAHTYPTPLSAPKLPTEPGLTPPITRRT